MYTDLDLRGEVELRARNNYGNWTTEEDARANIYQAIDDIVNDFKADNEEKINELATEMVND